MIDALLSLHVSGLLAAVFANLLLGAVWYAPAVCGNRWMRLTGVTQSAMKKATAKTMPAVILNSVVSASVIGTLLFLLGISNTLDLYTVLLWLWVAFSLVPALMHALFEHRPLGIACINACFEFLGFGLMGTILYMWAI